MAYQAINKGTVAGDGTGENLFSAFTKANANFVELYALTTPVNFSANKNAVDQTAIAVNTFTKITFGTEEWDVGGYYDAVNSRFIPPVGKYRLSAALFLIAGLVDAAAHELCIYKNGAAFKYMDLLAISGTTAPIINGSVLVNQTVGTDYYEVWYRGAGAGTKSVSGGAINTFFEGARI